MAEAWIVRLDNAGLTGGAMCAPAGNPAGERNGFGESVMAQFKQIVKNIVRDEQGGEVLEYALIAGLIVVAAIAVITSVGGKVVARWTSLDSSL